MLSIHAAIPSPIGMSRCSIPKSPPTRTQRTRRPRVTRRPVQNSASVSIEGDRAVVRVRPANPKFTTVLSIDGGGVRGLIPAAVLLTVETAIIEHMEKNDLIPEEAKGKEIHVDMADYFNCIAGTSVGSIVALYLASKGAACQTYFNAMGWNLRAGQVKGVVDLIQERASDVFPKPWYSWIPLLGSLIGGFMMIFFPKYSKEGVEEVLYDAFGELTLDDLDTGLVVPAFELSKNQAFSFWSSKTESGIAAVKPRAIPKNKEESDRPQKGFTKVVVEDDDELKWSPDIEFKGGVNYKLWQVARASSAAPTFFPATQFDPVSGDVGKDRSFVDGGVIANNPTMQTMAFIEAKLGTSMNSIAVLSLGTGHTQPDTKRLDNAGAFGWVLGGSLISILMDGSSEALQALVDLVYYKVQGVPLGQYVRISRCVDQGNEDEKVLSEMDNPDNAGALTRIGRQLGRENKAAIDEFVEKFIFA